MAKYINKVKNKLSRPIEIDIHQARLRTLLQVLQEKKAIIKIPLDLTGSHLTTTYGNSKEADYSFKKLLEVIWSLENDNPVSASGYAIDEYFRKKFKVISRKKNKPLISFRANITINKR